MDAGKGKRGRDEKEKEEEAPAAAKAAAVSPRNRGSIGVDTVSVPDKSATFAVWNLCDLGGGFQSFHWVKNNKDTLLNGLPVVLANIEADVIGLLEIKTGTCSADFMPKDSLKRTAFEIGALTMLMIRLSGETLGEDVLDKMMWVGEAGPLIEGIKSLLFQHNDRFINLSTKTDKNKLDDPEEIVNAALSGFAGKLKEPNNDKWIDGVYQLMVESCRSMYGDQNYVSLKRASDVNYGEYILDDKSAKRKERMEETFDKVKKAFKNAGMKQFDERQPTNIEAQGIPLISEALGKFQSKREKYEYKIIKCPEKEGETTAFLYNTDKFDFIRDGWIVIEKLPDSFRSAGYVWLKGKNKTLNDRVIMVVAWHAPSENNVGYRQWAYECLNNKIKDKPNNIEEVVLLADMNIRNQPALCEAGIRDMAYGCWLPEEADHMGFLTSLKKTGKDGAQWNHPFDKVLLLKDDKSQLEIKDHQKMDNHLSAEQIRVFSDHSWVKAKILPKK